MPSPLEGLGEQIVELLPRLRRFARALARNAHDADDLVQIAVERALSRSRQLREDAPLANWLFGILRNAWLDEARARARRDRLFAGQDLGEQVAAADTHSDLESLQQGLAQLPSEQREVIALVLVEGLSYREAAAVLEVPMGTVTSRLARGREALQRLLGSEAGEGS
jgi:RNA polymerase sigma-70 factor (ECF subfamily)